MKVWTIKHLPTGKFMPCRMFKQAGHGYTYWNPWENRPGYQPFDPNPRIFFTLQAARNARAMWLAGEWRKTKVRDDDWETFYFDVDGPPAPTVPETPRKREDVVIVEGELVLP